MAITFETKAGTAAALVVKMKFPEVPITPRLLAESAAKL